MYAIKTICFATSIIYIVLKPLSKNDIDLDSFATSIIYIVLKRVDWLYCQHNGFATSIIYIVLKLNLVLTSPTAVLLPA